MGPVDVNGGVHTARKQHHRICVRICVRASSVDWALYIYICHKTTCPCCGCCTALSVSIQPLTIHNTKLCLSLYIVGGFVLDSRELFCADSFPGDFINDDDSSALIFHFRSDEEYKSGVNTRLPIDFYRCAVRSMSKCLCRWVPLYPSKHHQVKILQFPWIEFSIQLNTWMIFRRLGRKNRDCDVSVFWFGGTRLKWILMFALFSNVIVLIHCTYCERISIWVWVSLVNFFFLIFGEEGKPEVFGINP